MFIIIAFWLCCDMPMGLLSVVPALLLSTLTPLFLQSSSDCPAVWRSAADKHLKLLNRAVSCARFLTGSVSLLIVDLW